MTPTWFLILFVLRYDGFKQAEVVSSFKERAVCEQTIQTLEKEVKAPSGVLLSYKCIERKWPVT